MDLDLPNEIRRTRLELKLSRPELARRLRCSPYSIKNWELGWREPPSLLRRTLIQKVRRMRKRRKR